ncbi:acyltransferase [Corallococcus llansteffanensis]|uniref:Condensation domain-containing protein n=1 Tax=Corallococcus llansteffanensis TaxID=2316731 RepID=A0A3A8QRU7_9BACT|nr:acyltransferase [Corallococcus llansteffanensis]RKH65864.1 hypothetical protein D7V93_05215 [Corallococcus llansteffanensis]
MAERILLSAPEAPQRTWALSAVDIALKDMFVSFALAFSGPIHTARFAEALRRALVQHPFFHGTLQTRNEALLLVSPAPTGNGAVALDVATVEDTLELKHWPALYRSAFIDGLVPKGRLEGQRDRPLLHLKLNHFQNASVVGLTWNHALSDLHGIYGFLGAVAQVYNGGDAPGAEPLFDRAAIWRELQLDPEAGAPPSREGRNGIVGISRLRAGLGLARYLGTGVHDAVPLCLLLDEDGVEALKAELAPTGVRASTNDVVNATLLKAFAECARDTAGTGDVGLYFPIDVRGLLGIPPGTLANCLGNASAVLSLPELSRASVAELTARNRAVVAAFGKAQLEADIRWADHWRRNTRPSSVYHHWLFGRDRVYSSNWSSQDLTRLHFEDAAFVAMLRSSRINRWLPLPAFHSTVLPLKLGEGRPLHVVRTSVRQRHFQRLARQLPQWPHVREVLRMDTGERLLAPARAHPGSPARGGPGGGVAGDARRALPPR